MQKHFVIFLIALLCSVSIGCTKREDVSKNPQYGNFKDVTGIWKSKTDLYLCGGQGSTDILDVSVDTMFANKDNGGLGVISEGSEIEVTNLIKVSTVEITMYDIIGVIRSGPHSGRKVRLDPRLFLKNALTTLGSGANQLGPNGWRVDPERLERPTKDKTIE